jgi:hypothetical protein
MATDRFECLQDRLCDHLDDALERLDGELAEPFGLEAQELKQLRQLRDTLALLVGRVLAWTRPTCQALVMFSPAAAAVAGTLDMDTCEGPLDAWVFQDKDKPGADTIMACDRHFPALAASTSRAAYRCRDDLPTEVIRAALERVVVLRRARMDQELLDGVHAAAQASLDQVDVDDAQGDEPGDGSRP